MDVIGNGGLWWNLPPKRPNSCSRRSKPKPPSSSSSSPANARGGGVHFEFPLKQAVVASALSLTGDTIAQLRDRFLKHRCGEDNKVLWFDHDWLRSLRMVSYGFLIYGPGSYAWYQFLDRSMPQKTVLNLSLKVILNQIILGPCVIAIVFAWNNLWRGKISELPTKYQKDALPTLLYGFRFWIPVSILNFWVVPISARVAFMSTGSIFWNFYLSSTLSK